MKIFLSFVVLFISVSSYGQSTLIDKASGSKYTIGWNCDVCELTWTGNAVDSLPNGVGVLTVSYQSEQIIQYEGEMKNGLFDGKGRFTNPDNTMIGFFKDGNFVGSDLAFLDNIEKINVSDHDPYSLYTNDGRNNTKLYYYKMIPDGRPVGVLTIIPSGGETTENLIRQISLHKEAVKNGFLVIIPSLNWGTDDRKPEIAFLDTIFKQVVEKHDAPKDKFIFCGLSNGGMISFRYAINSVKDSNTFIVPNGIIGLDPPLDFARFYAYCEREVERNYSPAGVGEAKWLLNNYNNYYGGSPSDFPQAYIDGSTFSYGAPQGGNAKYLSHIGVRMFSDLDLDYLLNKRKRDMYDWNGTDIVAFVNQLNMNGNTNAQVTISQNKGMRLNGTKHPHSWSIMDTDDAINWILKTVK